MRAVEFTKSKVAESVDSLFEINMSSKNLERLVADIPGARVGIEFEMVVPGIGSTDNDDDFESEPDMDMDERVYDITDAVGFFANGDRNSPGDIRRLKEKLEEQFNEWVDEKLIERWDRDRREIVSDYIVNNDLESEKEEDEDFDEFLDRKLEDADFVGEVFDEWRVEEYGEFDERDFFRDQRWRSAGDVYDEYNGTIEWPYWTEAPESGGSSIDADVIVKDFGRTLGVKVNYSPKYHGGSKSEGAWRIEPDSSIDPDDDDDGGLEFITPHGGLPLDEMITKMEEVRAWALANGCYTNSSTGLHINVSVPNLSRITVDYVKLVLLLGDNYVLDLFGRSANTYAKSSYQEIVSRIKSNPTGVTEVLDKMKKYLAHLGAQSIHNGSTNKYVSANFKGDYVEFRSPGGDWLNEKYWSQVKNTIFRFVVALDAATKPDKYREEYLKKLYKLIAPPGKELEMGSLGKLIAGYLSGDISREFILQRYSKAAKQPQPVTEPTPDTASNIPPGNIRYEAYEVYVSDTNQPIGTFLARANDTESARRAFNSFLTNVLGRSSPAGYGYREVT
jgi:hypothetical protein